MRTWGLNDWGQLGDNTQTRSLSPVPVPGLTNVEAIAAGGWQGLALRRDRTLWMWGANNLGQLGNGTTTGAIPRAPAKVPGLTDVEAIAAGGWHVLASR